MSNAPLKILHINASGRQQGSVSRQLSAELTDALQSRHGAIEVTRRDLRDGVPFVSEAWIAANFTPEEERNAEQRDVLSYSDELVAELKASDAVVVGVPIYNFSIPAALKAWIDMISRARLTFRYTEKGPRGLLEGKKAYFVVASGGVAVGGDMDFATPYLRHALGFVGISDIEIIAAERLNSNRDESIDVARIRIADIVHTSPTLGGQAA